MKDACSTDQEVSEAERVYSSMPKSDLKTLAVSAILEHRRLIVVDEVVYAKWMRAFDDPTTPRSVLKSLQDEYLACQQKAEAQQRELSKILDVLGYIPDIFVDPDANS
jgi:TraR antiactivator